MIGRDLSVLLNPSIKNEGDLKRIEDCVNHKRFSWPFEIYSETSSARLYCMLRSLGESVGVRKNFKFCDIGFGSGVVLAAFAILGYKTYGIDMRKQPLKHAPYFFKKVQQEFGKFNYQPQVMQNSLIYGNENISFPDATRINEMELYYAFINDDISTTPYLMQLISPKKGALVLHSSSHYPDGPQKIPAYKSLGFRLINKNKQQKDIPKEAGICSMRSEYMPVLIKE